MFFDFLKFNTTFASELRDFPQWHKGIKYFGFWAIEITSTSCIKKIRLHQENLKNRLHPNYLRQPHVTLVASGLLSSEHFDIDLIKSQVEQIKESNIKPFTLKLSNCNSFSTCPYLCISDSFGNLDLIRECLNKESFENDPALYTPHVTLGFYDKAYKTSDIVKDIHSLISNDIEFTVKELVFCKYQTKEIQGAYEVLHRIKLE